MPDGICAGGGATRLFAVGTIRRTGLRTSTVYVANWVATWTLFGSGMLGATFTKLYTVRCSGRVGAAGSSPFLFVGAHSRCARSRVAAYVPKTSCSVTVGL